MEKRNKLLELIERYVNAAVEDSWKGGGDQDDIPHIEKRFKRTKAELEAWIATNIE